MKEVVVGVLISVLVVLPSVPKEGHHELPPNAGQGRNEGAEAIDSLRIPTTWPWAKRIAESFVLRHPGSVTYDSGSPNPRWNYEQGLMLEASSQTRSEHQKTVL